MQEKKAQDYINEVKTTLTSAESCLQQACNKAEKTQNKEKIENALHSIKTACDCLNQYRG